MAATSGSLRTTLTASGALTTAMLPVFLLGALSDAIRGDLGLDETAIGAAVTVLFVAAGAGATPAGHMTERIGAGAALRTGVTLAGLATATIGLVATSWWQLAVPLAVVGICVGLIDTGAARAFAEGIGTERQGSAFGLKEASVPSASLLAGLALPTLAAWVGWRGVFVAAPLVAVTVLVLLPRRTVGAGARRPPPRSVSSAQAPGSDEVPRSDARTRPVLLAVGAGIGAGAATAAATFLVPALTSRGLSPAAAGLTLSTASVASIGARIWWGRWADRGDAPAVRATAALLAAGAVAAGALAADLSTPLVVAAAVVLLGAGWGWTGLAFLAVVRAHPGAPAVAAGIVLTGLGIGGALGPLAFGALVGGSSYAVAWAATAAALGVGAVVVAAASR